MTHPEDVNYQGKFFKPTSDYIAFPNAAHTFENKNIITVTSFETNGKDNSWLEPEISYTYYSHNDKTDSWEADNTTAGWLTLSEGTVSGDNKQKDFTFVASMSTPTSTTINSLFPTSAKGSKTSPYNLSNENGGSNVENTANCYMVGAPGWYCFPLVYGNAITGGNDNTNAYSSSHIVNHLKKTITKPYIKDNAGINLNPSNVDVKLIWQDAEKLIDPNEIIYDSSLFEGKGGIKFHIGTIQEGNAVIALIDKSATEDDFVTLNRGDVYGTSGSTKAVWSWHIWATRFGFDFEKNIQILNHEEKQYDVMPVNLGWCSGGKEIRYYKRRKCDIKFKVGENEIIRTIEQYPHFAVPRGDHPYYQWGRKDPFVGTNLARGNKQRWDHDNKLYDVWGEYNPPRLYQEPNSFQNNAGRKNTVDCLDVLVKNPDKWHNAKREPDPNNPPYKSINESYDDLWSNNGYKTVYDPCPAGYQVGNGDMFTGFTTTGLNAVYPKHWYDVLEVNMLSDYYDKKTVNREVLELYTDPRKVQSITFPVTGYRDFDGHAEVTFYPDNGTDGEGFVWTNKAANPTKSFHLKFHRNKMTDAGNWEIRISSPENPYIGPIESFYNCDGMAVRPVSSRIAR